MLLKDHVWKLLRETSIKGIGRTLKAESKVIRLVWVTAVLGFGFFSIQQVTVLVSRYTSYSTVSSITVNSWTEKTPVEDGSFPHIVLCNTNPLRSSLRGNSTSGVLSLGEFFQLVPEAIYCTNCSERFRGVNLANYIRTGTGYFQYVGMEGFDAVSRKFVEFVLDCTLQIYSGTTFVYKPCKDYVKITQLLNPVYFRCYRFELVPETILSNKTIGFTILTYVMNDMVNNNSSLRDKTAFHQAGVRLALVEPQRGADLFRLSDYMDVGKLTHVKFGITKKRRQRPPYGNCQDDHFLDEILRQSEITAESDNKYSRDLCTKLCVMTNVLARCGCVDVTMLDSSIHMDLHNKTFCGTYDPLTQLHVERLTCALTVHFELDTVCVSQCGPACHQTFYDTRLSQGTWPLLAMYRNFMADILARHPFINDAYNEFMVSAGATNVTGNTTQYDIVRTGEFIKHNFAKFEVVMPATEYQVLEDHPHTVLTDLLSSVGGTLNLWSGITIYLVFELVEFLYDLVMDSLPGRAKRHPSHIDTAKIEVREASHM